MAFLFYERHSFKTPVFDERITENARYYLSAVDVMNFLFLDGIFFAVYSGINWLNIFVMEKFFKQKLNELKINFQQQISHPLHKIA